MELVVTVFLLLGIFGAIMLPHSLKRGRVWLYGFGTIDRKKSPDLYRAGIAVYLVLVITAAIFLAMSGLAAIGF